MKRLLPIIALGALVTALAASCSSPSSSDAIRTNDGISIYAPSGGRSAAPC